MSRSANFVLVGVGGQGTLLAADLVSLAGMAAGLDVIKSEVHGMAQRGGSVVSQVRWGRQVLSPLVTPGEADFLVGFERLEAVRYSHWLRPTGVALVNDYRLPPITMARSGAAYPSEEDEVLAMPLGARRHVIPALRLAQEMGNLRTSNVVLVGALAGYLPLDSDLWLHVIRERMPEALVEANTQAFMRGFHYVRRRPEGEACA